MVFNENSDIDLDENSNSEFYREIEKSIKGGRLRFKFDKSCSSSEEVPTYWKE